MSEPLKSCPFCGSNFVDITDLERGDFVVQCFNCGSSCGTYTDCEQASEAWNKRAASEADSVSQTKPAESASGIPQIPVSDLESEWTVLEENFGKIAVVCGDNWVALCSTRPYAQQLCDAHNASLRQLRETVAQLTERKDRLVKDCVANKAEADALREQKEEAERENVLMTDQINAQNIRYETLQEKVKPLVGALRLLRELRAKSGSTAFPRLAKEINDFLAQLKPETKL